MDAQPIGGAGERWKAALRSPDRLEDDVHRTEGISAALPRGEPIYLGSRSPSSGPTPWGELGARRATPCHRPPQRSRRSPDGRPIFCGAIFPIEHDIVGGEGSAVMPLHACFEFPGHGQAVGSDPAILDIWNFGSEHRDDHRDPKTQAARKKSLPPPRPSRLRRNAD